MAFFKGMGIRFVGRNHRGICVVTAVLAALLLTVSPGGADAETLRSGGHRLGVAAGLNYGHLLRGNADKNEVKQYISENAKALEELGIRINRLHNWNTFRWDSIERSKGEFDWEIADHVVRTAQEHHIELVATLYLVSYWGASRPYVARDWNDYRNFVKKVVERYDGDGFNDMPGLKTPIKYWEIENEPAPVPSVKGTGMPPEAYMDILVNGYKAVKEADPEAKVLLGGLMQNNQGYLKALLALGAGDYFDIMNYHFYSYTPEEKELEDVARSFDQILKDRGLNKPTWLTETAATSKTKRGPLVRNLTRSQARAAVKIPVVAFANGSERVFWHTLRDAPDIFSGDVIPPEGVALGGGEAYYSLVEFEGYGGKKKPSFYTYRLLAMMIGDFEAVKTLGPGTYQFRFKGKKPVFVLWSRSAQTVDLSVHTSSPKVKLTRIVVEEGETEAKTETVPANAVPINESPVFVEEVKG